MTGIDAKDNLPDSLDFLMTIAYNTLTIFYKVNAMSVYNDILVR